MNDRRHLERDDTAERGRSTAPPRERHENAETAAVLDLQERAGNRAVAGMLETRGADARGATLQLQPAGQAPNAEPAKDEKTSAAPTMTIPKMKLSIPILSYSLASGRPTDRKAQSGDLTVSVALKDIDPRIAQAVARGDRFDEITIEAGTHKITMKGVMLSSFQIGGETATLTLDFESMEFGPGGQPPAPEKESDYAL